MMTDEFSEDSLKKDFLKGEVSPSLHPDFTSGLRCPLGADKG
jgi:hypothetical protein